MEEYMATQISIGELREMERMLSCYKERLADEILDKMLKAQDGVITKNNIILLNSILISYKENYRPEITNRLGRSINLRRHDHVAENLEYQIRDFESTMECVEA